MRNKYVNIRKALRIEMGVESQILIWATVVMKMKMMIMIPEDLTSFLLERSLGKDEKEGGKEQKERTGGIS